MAVHYEWKARTKAAIFKRPFRRLVTTEIASNWFQIQARFIVYLVTWAALVFWWIISSGHGLKVANMAVSLLTQPVPYWNWNSFSIWNSLFDISWIWTETRAPNRTTNSCPNNQLPVSYNSVSLSSTFSVTQWQQLIETHLDSSRIFSHLLASSRIFSHLSRFSTQLMHMPWFIALSSLTAAQSHFRMTRYS